MAKMLYPFLIVVALALVGYAGGSLPALQVVFGIIIPYIAMAAFVAGFAYRMLGWVRSPVPFRITTTAGQQRSLPWIKANNLEAPANKLGVLGRMALEVLLFRSLFRNTSAGLRGKRLLFGEEKLLWAGGLLFHYSFLVIILRHTRFFLDPVPFFVPWLQAVDGFFQVGVPAMYITTATILVALLFLFARRVVMPQIRYISLPADYFPLFLILGIGTTGVLMRHFFRVDIEAVKELALSLVVLQPRIPANVGPLFFAHLALVSSLLVYFPLSKLMHMGGIFLSPTRNLTNDNRRRRHVNPWNYPVPTHSYAEWQEEFKEKLEMAGIPLDEDLDHKPEMAAARGGHA
ncbi:MAG: sulfate reduction electron transfer complex DsrMKJOP subunit DsrM [Chloroflexi bacterium]|nr:sulfate reduction electron transfer complex DsrMKJOP subunit DsrM [Chloroflexota bacterium]MCL5107448.1 sulfate reduction electron transfer complex DsrMKJOP subunit DsrM [Chloroflexota bacterium]